MATDTEIRETIFSYLAGLLSDEALENWAYETVELEAFLGDDDYLEFVSADFRSNAGIYEARKILLRRIDRADLMNWKIAQMMRIIISRPEDVHKTILETYDLYCRGYEFLRSIGLGYGLRVAAPSANGYSGGWGDLSPDQKEELIDRFYPQISEEAAMLLKCFKAGKLRIVKAEFDDLMNIVGHHVEFEDTRSPEEIQSMSTPIQI